MVMMNGLGRGPAIEQEWLFLLWSDGVRFVVNVLKRFSVLEVAVKGEWVGQFRQRSKAESLVEAK
jgi:hypothetical protein